MSKRVDPGLCRHVDVTTADEWAWMWIKPGTPNRRKVKFVRMGKQMDFEPVECLDCGLFLERRRA